MTGSKAAPAAAEVPEVPGENIFGFTSPTDIGKPGDFVDSYGHCSYQNRQRILSG